MPVPAIARTCSKHDYNNYKQRENVLQLIEFRRIESVSSKFCSFPLRVGPDLQVKRNRQSWFSVVSFSGAAIVQKTTQFFKSFTNRFLPALKCVVIFVTVVSKHDGNIKDSYIRLWVAWTDSKQVNWLTDMNLVTVLLFHFNKLFYKRQLRND